MQKFREINQFYWLSALVLIFSVGCADDKKFEGKSRGSNNNAGSSDPHTTNEDDTPLQFPSMITASQFLINCQAKPSQKTAAGHALKVGCYVKSPVHGKFFKSIDWIVDAPDSQQISAEITPSQTDVRAADISFPVGSRFPLRVSAKIAMKTGMEPFEVAKSYANFEEFLPPLVVPACHNRIDRIQRAKKFYDTLGGMYAYMCYTGQIDAYLQCNSNQPVFNPKGC